MLIIISKDDYNLYLELLWIVVFFVYCLKVFYR